MQNISTSVVMFLKQKREREDLNVQGNNFKIAINIIKKSKENMNNYQDEEQKNMKS